MKKSQLARRVTALLVLFWVCVQPSARAADDVLPAMIPVELLPLNPDLASGGIVVRGLQWSRPYVGLQPARVPRGIAVDKWTGGKRILALTLLGKVERDSDGRLVLDVPPDRLAWCDIAAAGMVVSQCLQDLDGDGKLEINRRGWLGASKDPLSLNRVEAPQPSEPLAYRAAAPEELQQFEIGYNSCESKIGESLGATSELRYSTAVRRPHSGLLPNSATPVCNEIAKFIERREDGSAAFQFGRFKVSVQREEKGFKTTLIEGITPGTLLGHVRVDRPLIDAVNASANIGDSEDKPFLYALSEPKVTSEPVPRGGEILSMEVAHGITGTLAAEAKTRGWSKAIHLPAGTPMYGAEMTQASGPGSFDTEIVWCAPQQDEKGKEVAWCFIRGPIGFVLESNLRPYVLQYISSSGGKGVDAPVVTRGPVDFGAPIFLKVHFERATRQFIYLNWNVATKDGARSDGLRLRLAEDGAGNFLLGKLIIKVIPSKDGKQASVETSSTFESGMNAIPLDVERVFEDR